MATPFLVEANTHVIFPFTMNRRGVFKYRMSASAAVGAYIVDADGLNDFRGAQRFYAYAGARRKRYHSLSARLEQGEYYIMIVNPSADPVACEHDV